MSEMVNYDHFILDKISFLSDILIVCWNLTEPAVPIWPFVP